MTPKHPELTLQTPRPRKLRKFWHLAALAILLATAPTRLGSIASAQDARQAVPKVETAKPDQHPLRPMFDALVAAIENRFVNVEKLKELNWRARAEAVWPDIATAKTAADAAPRLNALLAELKTSHTQVFTAEDPEFYILADVFGQSQAVPEVWGGPSVVPSIGIFTAKFEGRDHITHSLEGSPADKAGLKVGDEVVSIDGTAYKPVASFRTKIGTMATVEFRRQKDDPTSKLDVPVVLMQPTAAFERATANSARIIEKNGKRIGYVHLWQMREKDALANALETIDASRQTAHSRRRSGPNAGERLPTPDGERVVSNFALDALIVDNRTKIGGQGEVGRAYLETLASNRGGTIQAISRRSDLALRPAPKSFAGRSVMLIDGGTRSAAELFAFGYAQDKMGPLMGTRTAGAVTGASAQILPGGLLLYIGIADITIDGQRLEGTGVAPTTEIARPIPYSGGADPVLDAAIEHLAKPSAHGAPRP